MITPPLPRDIRLVATDVDGTLLDHEARLPPARAAAVRRLTAAGIPVVLATGKVWPSLRELWDELGLPGPHVTCNGAAVVDRDERIHALRTLDTAVAEEVAETLERRHIPHATYLDDGSIVAPTLYPELAILPALGEPEPVHGRPDGRGVLKVLSVLGAEDEGELRSLAADVARVQRTSHRFLEWGHPEADKAAGLRTVVAELGIELADVVAIGDAENDLPMLRVAGTGVAVAEASDAAVGAADLHLVSDLADFLDEIAAAAERAVTRS